MPQLLEFFHNDKETIKEFIPEIIYEKIEIGAKNIDKIEITENEQKIGKNQ